MFKRFLALSVLLTAFSLLICGASQTIIVTKTADSGAGTLRDAILKANASGVSTLIQFDIPESDPGFDPVKKLWTIKPITELPQIIVPVIIDGYTQRGSCPNCAPLTEPDNASIQVVIEGAGSGLLDRMALIDPTTGIRGITLDKGSDGSIIKGLAIVEFPVGVEIISSHSSVRGMFLGVDPDGFSPRLNGVSVLIHKDADAAWIGSGKLEDRNVIAGIGYQRAKEIAPLGAITIQGTNTAVQTTTVGLTATGDALPVPPEIPLVAGIVADTTTGTAIGASNPTPPPPPQEPAPIVPAVVVATFPTNIVTFNPSNTLVSDALVGTNNQGTMPIQQPTNNIGGVSILFAIGGNPGAHKRDVSYPTVSVVNSLVSGNKGAGITIAGDSTTAAQSVKVINNKIGTDITGTKPLSNGGNGLLLINARDTVIQCSTINHNGGHGVHHLESVRTTVDQTDASYNGGDGFNFLPVSYVEAAESKVITVKGDTTAECVCDNDDSDGCLCARFTYGTGQVCC